MVLSGYAVAYRRVGAVELRASGAYGLAPLALVVLRAVGGSVLRDMKEILFAAPLVSVHRSSEPRGAGRRDRWGRLAALVLLGSLVAFGLARYAGDLLRKIALLES